MNFKKIKLLLLFLLLQTSVSVLGQDYLLSNEVLIFSFKTKSGKAVLAKDKNNKYIIYRFGTKDKIEFEFPAKTKESWQKFKYSYYMRGGGNTNDAIDLNYLAFTTNTIKYIIYDTYFSVGNKSSVGIKIIDLKTTKITDIKGQNKRRKGTLIDFRNNKVIGTDNENELYD